MRFQPLQPQAQPQLTLVPFTLTLPRASGGKFGAAHSPTHRSLRRGFGEWSFVSVIDMNQAPTPRWSSGPDDEFANFLDFSDLGFGDFDGVDLQQNGAGAMDISMEGAAGMLGLEQGHMQPQQQPSPMDQQNHGTPMNGFHGSTESFPDLAMQQDLFDQQQQQQLHMQNQRYHSQNVVPPTPNSLEMHGGHAQYYRTPADQQQLHIYDHYRRNQKDQVGAPH